MAELKPCPFCGGKTEAFKLDPFYVNQKRISSYWGVHCLKCGVQMVAKGGSKKEAIEAWNRRKDNG